MDLTLGDLKCPKCGLSLESGTIRVSDDVQMVKKCRNCGFWMIIIIPNDDYDYSIKKELKEK